MKLGSYVQGHWHVAPSEGEVLRDATTGEIVATASSVGVDFAGVLDYARQVGGPALRALTFHERAALLKNLARKLGDFKEEFYTLSYCTGATKNDSMIDIDGGIGTVAAFAAKASRQLPNARVLIDGDVEGLSKSGGFVGQHIHVSREGAALQINAFNFPVWGMLEKLAPAFLAGMPSIVKPASATAYLTERVVRAIVDAKLLPQGALQLVCGNGSELLNHLTCQDVVSFTGSAATAARLRLNASIIDHAVPFIAETDSLNSSILGLDAVPGTPEFELYVREVVREMTVKAGQKCTAIRKALVPTGSADAVVEALRAALGKIVIGDPRLADVRMGPLVNRTQRNNVLAHVAELRRESDLVMGDPDRFALLGADPSVGAFVPPLLLRVKESAAARTVHEVEAFGPVASVMTYKNTGEAIELARRGLGSLVASVFTADDDLAAKMVLGLAPYHGRILVANGSVGKESTGHGTPLAPLIHGGPGRAGGGEEMGGMRGVLHYMLRVAVQGSPNVITATAGRWVRGSRLRAAGVGANGHVGGGNAGDAAAAGAVTSLPHPFRIPFNELRLGDTLKSAEREVTVEDIESFAALSGDNFYAHMDESQAARNPLFGGRVAHGYFLISAAAGLFVNPDYGPVLGNYGIDKLRFVKPVKPGDRIKVRLTCAEKSLRADKGWGEVGWDTELTNQNDETVASYTVLTMVSVHAVPDAIPQEATKQ